MSPFLKIEGESVWLNMSRVDGVIVRPQLQQVGSEGHAALDPLEEPHRPTGLYEVAVFFQGQLSPVQSFQSRAEAEAFVEELLSRLG